MATFLPKRLRRARAARATTATAAAVGAAGGAAGVVVATPEGSERVSNHGAPRREAGPLPREKGGKGTLGFEAPGSRPRARRGREGRRRGDRGRGAPALPVREIFKRFWPHARPYRRRLPPVLLLVAPGPAVEAAVIRMYKLLVDTGEPPSGARDDGGSGLEGEAIPATRAPGGAHPRPPARPKRVRSSSGRLPGARSHAPPDGGRARERVQEIWSGTAELARKAPTTGAGSSAASKCGSRRLRSRAKRVWETAPGTRRVRVF